MFTFLKINFKNNEISQFPTIFAGALCVFMSALTKEDAFHTITEY